jgi:hypothetical protein
LQGSSDRKAGETQLLSFPQRDVFKPAPQPAVGAGHAGPHGHAAHAANDVAGSKRRGRYNWDGRYIGKPADEADSPSLARRVLLPVGGLALLAGVALGAFYFMHSFAPGPAGTSVAAPANAQAAATAAAEKPAPAVAGTSAVETGAIGDAKQAAAAQDVAGRVASTDKALPSQPAPSQTVAAAATMKVPAPDNARWGDEPDAAPAAQANDPKAKALEAQAAAGKAEATAEVKEPQSAPAPTEAPKKLAYAAPEPKPARPLDKAVTASLPPARAAKGSTPPGVDPNLLSIPAKASVDAPAPSESATGGYLGTVKSGVKMHSGAGNHTGTVGVIPDNATVRVLNCDGWCKVSYNGKQGYIYKTFLGGGSAAAAAKSAPAPASAAPAQEPPKKTADAAPAGSTPAPSALEAAGQHNLTTRTR